ncbi:T6SS immunity protein Tli4 family protein [Halopseudomonas xiamenensis]|uniref:T6SS immunity protein Tli4 family protein n=1 Tax=Halopseudomonas xiamenensis TaxID=157792 RepID=UPI001EE9F64E|nr:T6SS immunity protein Tli4 family protein [Halopseudomonas xiamenensis]
MKRLNLIIATILGLLSSHLMADQRQECLGRHVFEVPEGMEWATYDASRVFRISTGGGHNFTAKVGAKGDSVVYGPYGAIIKVSDIVERSEFEAAANYQLGTGRLNQKRILENIDIKQFRLSKLPGQGYGPEVIQQLEREIAELEAQVPLALYTVHDLGIPDAFFIGGQGDPTHAYLYRNQRVYYFVMRRAGDNGTDAFVDLMSRFQPRELYEVPEGNGICIPYGFIADDGKAPYSIKNSLRFTQSPNVVFTLLTASASDPWHTKSTSGLYDTDFRPGYDREKWTWREYVQPSWLGTHKTQLLGWTLEPKPDSGEQERAWFGFAERGGVLNPLLAVHMLTFQQGTDDLTEHTPPMETVLPRWEALAQTLRLKGEQQ